MISATATSVSCHQPPPPSAACCTAVTDVLWRVAQAHVWLVLRRGPHVRGSGCQWTVYDESKDQAATANAAGDLHHLPSCHDATHPPRIQWRAGGDALLLFDATTWPPTPLHATVCWG